MQHCGAPLAAQRHGERRRGRQGGERHSGGAGASRGVTARAARAVHQQTQVSLRRASLSAAAQRS